MSGSVPRTPMWAQLGAIALVVVPLIALSQIRAHWETNAGSDQKMFAYYGWRIAQGATVYVDVWDNKPPGIYWLNALGFWISRGHYAGVVAVCVAALIATHLALYACGRMLYSSGAATLTTMLAACYLLHPFYEGGTDRTETFLVAFELCAMVAYLVGVRRNRAWLWLAAGLLCGGGLLCKQVGLAALAGMGLHTIALGLSGKLGRQATVWRAALLVLGTLSTLAVAGVVLAAQGALQEAWGAVVLFNRAYFATGASRLSGTYTNSFMICGYVTEIMLLPALLAFIALARPLLHRCSRRLAPRTGSQAHIDGESAQGE